MKSIVLLEGISTDFPPMDGSYWFRIGINGKREKPRFRMRLVEMRLGSIEGIWSLLNRIKDKESIVRCCWRGGEEVKFGNGSIVVAQT